MTLRLANAVPPLPPSTEVIAPVVLFFVPAVVPVTFALKLHEALAASVALAKLLDARGARPASQALHVRFRKTELLGLMSGHGPRAVATKYQQSTPKRGEPLTAFRRQQPCGVDA